MKELRFYTAIAAAALLAGCTSAYYSASGYGGDDLYATHDKTEIARRQQAEAEARKAAAEARRAEWEALIAEAEASAAEENYYQSGSSSQKSYSSVLADTYESAYARRLRGFRSPTYRMPSSYYNFRYGDSFHYVSAYDPAFYNIVISGDEVWVEPKYITSMFGTWGGTVYAGWNIGWSFGPSYWWNYPYYNSWYGWNNWGWGFSVHPWHDPWHYHHPGWGPGWAHRPPRHNYRLDSYPNRGGNYRPGNSGGSPGRVTPYNPGRGNGYNSGRTGSYNNRGGGSYNNRGGSYNDRGGSIRNNGSRGNGYDRRSNSYNGSRSESYNSGRSGSTYNGGSYNGSRSSGSFGGSSSSSFGGGSSSGSSGRGGGSYNSGR